VADLVIFDVLDLVFADFRCYYQNPIDLVLDLVARGLLLELLISLFKILQP
jgi:hypothetical protein